MEDEWETAIAKDEDWSKEETDHLLDMCERFDLRFVAIHDRYEARSTHCQKT